MNRFAALLDRLVFTPQRNAKIALLVEHFATTPDPDRGWALAAMTGGLNFPAARAAMVRGLIATRMDPQLFALSYDFVGDLAETIALAWPTRPGANRAPTLDEVVQTLAAASRAEAPGHVERWLDALDESGRWALLKVVTGGLRIGVSARLAKVAAASYGDQDVAVIEEIWHGLDPPYTALFAWLDGDGPQPRPSRAGPFRPVMLAHPLVDKAQRGDADAVDPARITPDIYAAEWKWDGVRVQAVREGDVRRLYSRTGDDISAAFPDVTAALAFDGAVDGELLVRAPGGDIASFNALQQRLNRKTVSTKAMQERPALVRAYDLLIDGDEDLRDLAFRERRARLEARLAAAPSPALDLSPLVAFEDARALDALRVAPPHAEIEGVMVKRWDAVYVAGRPKGLWFKWKRDPRLIDAVLLYAQRGHGRRSSLYSDFTFGVWRDGPDGAPQLAPVGKAYFGFTDAELKRLDAFVREHTTDRFGPVRAVTATQETGLVLEVAFDAVNASTRHKAGLALRFPRINRIRWDKPPHEADTLGTLAELVT